MNKERIKGRIRELFYKYSTLDNFMNSRLHQDNLDNFSDEILEATNGGAADYWKTRCLLAEKYINKSPYDPDITKEQIKAYGEWKEFITKSRANV